MATGPHGQKRPGDAIECAVRVGRLAIGEAEETQTAGQILGRQGGKARAEKLSPRRRKQIAKKGAEARWKDHTPKQ